MRREGDRVNFTSKLGVVLAAAGSAVGLGNVWRFPTEVGNNGGAAFILIYLLCVLAVGVPVMVSEFLIGRHTHANTIAASLSTAKFLASAGTPSESTDESLNMILIPQTLTAATAYASTTAGAKPNGSYIALKMVIKNNTTAGETVADATTDGKWAMWPIGGYNWEPGKKYTYTIDLAGGGYYETNQEGTDGNLDAILEGAEITC